MPVLRFELPKANVNGRQSMKFRKLTPPNGTYYKCPVLCVAPVELEPLQLSISLTYSQVTMGTWEVTVTLTVTNNTGEDVGIDTLNLTPAITWTTGTGTIISDGATDSTMTGTFEVTTAGDVTVSGSVDASSYPSGTTSYTSNTDSETITIS